MSLQYVRSVVTTAAIVMLFCMRHPRAGWAQASAGSVRPTSVATASIAQGVSQLLGAWTTSCHAEVPRHSSITQIAFSGSRYIIVSRWFGDQQCQKPTFILVSEGLYSVRNYHNGLLDFDQRTQRTTIRPLDPAVVTHNNAHVFCGLTRWSLDEDMPVDGRHCGAHVIPEAGQTTFSILRILGEQLVFGMSTPGHDGSSEIQRHADLDIKRVFTRLKGP